MTAAIAAIDPLLVALYNANLAGGEKWITHVRTDAAVERFVYTPLDGVAASTIITHSLAGLDVGDSLPADKCLVVSLRTAKRGRSYRGRVFWGPYREVDNQATGIPTASSIAGAATQWNGFIASLVGSSVSLVIASYLHSTADDVLAANVNSTWRTQRRRLRP